MMKRTILIIGQGNIGSFLGASLKQEETNNVVHFVRNKSEKPKTTTLLFRDRRNTSRKINKNEVYEYTQTEDCKDVKNADLIIIPVRHTQWKQVLDQLKPHVHPNQTFVLCGNVLDDFEWFEKNIPCPYVFAFPNFGGAIIDNKLTGWLTSKCTTGVSNPNFQPQLQQLMNILQHVGFNPKMESDIKGWLMTHFAYNAGMLAAAARHDGFQNLTSSFSYLKKMFEYMQLCVDVIKKSGIPVHTFPDGKAVYRPVWWNALKTYLLFLIPGLAKSADAAKDLDEWTSYMKSLQQFAQKNQIQMPDYGSAKS